MVEKFRAFLRKRGIKSRMFFAFIVLPIVIMVLIFLLYYYSSMNIIVSKNRQNSQMTVSLTEENIYLNSTKLEEQLTNIMNSTLLANIFNEPNNETYRNEFSLFIQRNMYFMERKNLVIFDLDGNVLYDENNKLDIDFEEVKQANSVYGTTKHWHFDEATNQVSLLSPITINSAFVGYIVCGFDELSFSPSFSRVDSAHNMLVVVDENDKYLFGSSILNYKTHIDTSKKRINLDQGGYYIESTVIKNMDWKVVNLISSDYLMEEFHNFRNMILIYGIVIVIILEIIATLIYRSIYDPLHNILKTMRKIDENNIISARVEDEGNDEIHEVAKNFNELLDRVEDLLKTVESEQEQKRETQILLLQAQINPHFLFNTLNTLHFLAMMNEDKPVSEGIGALAKLLRNTIVDSKEVVTVREEIENLKNYIVIQKLRFGDLFETVYNVDEDVKECKILKFLLQPIVENSILHAFEEDKETQFLAIRIQKKDKYLKIGIGDNGKGFLSEEEKKKTTLSGIGIDNIKERIQLMYGDTYSMDIESVPGKGTIVTLLLPYVEGDVYVQSIDRR